MDKIQILKELVSTFGISGFEGPIREKIKELFPQVDFKEDEVGNLSTTIGSGGKRIAFMAHMDELGFLINYVEKNGYLRFKPIGGWDVRSVYNRVVEILTDQGIVQGVIGLKPPHLSKKEEMDKVLSWDDLYIDIGVESKPEATERGIVPILPARLKKDFIILNKKYVVTRALDDRVGCVLNLLLLDEFLHYPPPNIVTLVWTVQEETGLRGAKAFSAKNSFDEVYTLDTISAGNLPWGNFHLSPARTGGGPVIRLADRKGVSSLRLRNFVKEVARKNKIKVQETVTGGSTDAAAVFEAGLNSLPICIPVKYTHSQVEMMSIADYHNVLKLLLLIGTK
ncbi:MAG: M20/M25/M40 family metallo-hydrolase [Candidatus Caldatribacteriota bacterium]|nr:M20/M25/M40 family metallo-hydrolase [Candidatus Caldatribacteriota bacterium]